MSDERVAAIRQLLLDRFDPAELIIKDQSQLHLGHAGAKDGKGHFEIRIVSAEFAGQNRLERHRMVYDALTGLFQTDIHALRIKAFDPSER